MKQSRCFHSLWSSFFSMIWNCVYKQSHETRNYIYNFGYNIVLPKSRQYYNYNWQHLHTTQISSPQWVNRKNYSTSNLIMTHWLQANILALESRSFICHCSPLLLRPIYLNSRGLHWSKCRVVVWICSAVYLHCYVCVRLDSRNRYWTVGYASFVRTWKIMSFFD